VDLTPIPIADTREEEDEERIDLKSPESILVWVVRVDDGDGRTSYAPWSCYSIEHTIILSGAPGVTGAASYEGSYGGGLDELAENLIEEPAEGWWVVEGITGEFYKGDGWSTDDDMDFYCTGIRPATPQEIYENMTTEEMLSELRLREDATLTAIATELEKLGKLRLLVADFIVKHEIRCAETIYQTDRVMENAAEFIEALCDEVGYLPRGEDDE
jgi:hypothetical protein